MLTAIALLDYDNIVDPRTEHGALDVEANLLALRTTLVTHCQHVVIGLRELNLRIYGGWLTDRGQYTQRGEWLLKYGSIVRGRVEGVRVLPELATSIAACRSMQLIGSYRKRGTSPVQKMVDTMMAVDALHYVESDAQLVAIVSDDDDLVPPALAAVSKRRAYVHLVRRRCAGHGINDVTCMRFGVTISTLFKRQGK